MSKSNLESLYGGELAELRRLEDKGDNRIATGEFIFKSDTGGKETYTSQTGEEGMLIILSGVLESSLVSAEDINQLGNTVQISSVIGDEITIITGSDLSKFTLEVALPYTSSVAGFSIIKNGNAGKALKNTDGTVVTEITNETMFYNIIETDSDFYLASSGGDIVTPIMGHTLTESGSTVYDRTTPVQVIGSAYDTSGNGGRRLVRLDSGSFISELSLATDVRLLKSYDGITWSYLVSTGTSSVTGSSVATDGEYMYQMRCSTGKAYLKVYDEDGILQGAQYILESTSGTTGNCSLAISDDKTKITAVWSIKNSPYTSSFNIRAIQGTILAGIITWSSAEQLTSANDGGTDNTNPSVVYKADGYPTILYGFANPVVQSLIYCKHFNGSIWTTSSVTALSAYVQSNPSADVLSDGTIVVAWYGKDATDTTQSNIRFSESVDNGVTWSAVLKLTTGNTISGYFAPSISRNTDDEIFVLCHKAVAGNPNQITQLKYISSWVESNITTQSTGSALYPSTCSNFRDYEEVLTIWKDNEDTDVKFYGKWTEVEYEQTILADEVKSGKFVYCNEDTSLVLDTPIVTVFDKSSVEQTVGVYGNTSNNCGDKIVSDSVGNLYQVYTATDGSQDQVWCRKWSVATNTWSDLGFPHIVGHYQYIPSIAVDSNDDLHVVWHGNDPSNLFTTVKYSKFTTSWSAFEYVGAITEIAQYAPVIAIDSNDDIHVAWYGKDATHTSDQVKYSKFTTSWSAWVNIQPISGYTNYFCTIAVDSNDDVHIAWYGKDASNPTYYQIKYSKFTTSWSSWINISVVSGSSQYRPSITIDSNDDLHVVWHGADATTGGFYAVKYSKFTTSWSAWVSIQPISGHSPQYATLTFDLSGDLYVACHSTDASNPTYTQIKYSKFTTSWSAWTNVSTTTTDYNQFASICKTFNNFELPIIIWRDNGLTQVSIYGKWTGTITEQVIPSVDVAINETELTTIGDGVLKTIGSTDKVYGGNLAIESLGFTPLGT